jgi:hypothetical protein
LTPDLCNASAIELLLLLIIIDPASAFAIMVYSFVLTLCSGLSIVYVVLSLERFKLRCSSFITVSFVGSFISAGVILIVLSFVGSFLGWLFPYNPFFNSDSDASRSCLATLSTTVIVAVYVPGSSNVCTTLSLLLSWLPSPKSQSKV